MTGSNLLRAAVGAIAIGLLFFPARPACAAHRSAVDTHAYWAADALASHLDFESAVMGLVQPRSLRLYHDLFAVESHIAGTPGDLRLIEQMIELFRGMGLETERHEFHAYLAYPVRAELSIVSPVEVDLPLTERVLPEDPQTARDDLPIGFAAYSGSGEVTAEIVYANYGRLEDFETLRSLGIDVRGKIVLARFGGNFRGYKVKYAEEAGAAGVIMYTDPADSGYMRGMPYPEGGWANETSIQRGSILTLPYPGDPLTPFIEASETAPRLEHEDVPLPAIPVQPIGWEAAHQIMKHMTGEGLPPNLVRGWQGGLPLPYRIEGGETLRVRLDVEQERRIVPTANVIGRLTGVREPEKLVILGCHHDAWGIGAGDPLAGLICLFEIARCFGRLAEHGIRPARTILFAAWGAEEYGIIGSSEWVESKRDTLIEHAVAYINLDMAAMGPDFRASASPSLATIIRHAAKAVPSVRSPDRSVHDEWSQNGTRMPPVGDLGGGSDHLPFVCHVAVSSAALGAGGSHGVSYHSNYDTLEWYRRVVGDDYESARMISQVGAVLAARLANADLLPHEPAAAAPRIHAELNRLKELASRRSLDFDRTEVDTALAAFEEQATAFQNETIDLLRSGELDATSLPVVNRSIVALERRWLDPAGLHNRSWYRNLLVATDPFTGYGAWILPALHEAIADADGPRLELMLGRYVRVLRAMTNDLIKLRSTITPAPPENGNESPVDAPEDVTNSSY